MNIPEITKVIEIVLDLNNKIADSTENGFVPILNLQTNGEDVIIDYLGDCLWSSVDDERDIIDDKPEDLRNFLVEMINQTSIAIGEIKL